MSSSELPPVPPPELDEVDIDVNSNHDESIPDDAEYLGEYESIDSYLRATLEPEISASVRWLLDCLDMPRVLARFESDGSRLHVKQGKVFRSP